MKLLLLTLVSLLSTQVFAKEKLSFKQLKKTYRRADIKKITPALLSKNVLNKTFRCYEQFKDGGEGYRYLYFQMMGQRINEKFSEKKYSLKNTLVEFNHLGKVENSVRMTSDGSLVLMTGPRRFRSYAFCPIKSVVTTESDQLFSELKGENIIAMAINEDLSYAVITRNQDSQGVKTDQISVYDKNQNLLNKMSALEFYEKAGFGKNFKNFPFAPQIEIRHNKFLISGSFNISYSATTNYKIVEFDADLSLIQELKLPKAQGNLSVDKDGGLHFFHSSSESRSDTGITAYTKNEMDEEQISVARTRSSSNFVGGVFANKYAVVGWCTNAFRELYSCPEKGRNYTGISLISRDGTFVRFIEEYDHMESFGVINISSIHGLENGDFIVSYTRSGELGGSNFMTLFRYNSNGDYLNSWGSFARNPENRDITLIKNKDSDQLSFIGNKLYYFESDQILMLDLTE